MEQTAQDSAPRFQVWPIVRTEIAYSVPLAVLSGVWEQIVREGRDRDMFYDGGVTSREDFLRFCFAPGVYPLLVADADGPNVALYTWLTDVGGGTAKAHFCGLGPFRRGAYRAALTYWDSLYLACGSPMFNVLLGVTPETNTKALRAAEILGFRRVGTVPSLCDMRYEGRRVGGVITYRERGDKWAVDPVF